ncbi:MAG TPA: pyruvate ferredoxin oxidoreductase [Bacillota bacterium]|nr:pyruvate ferredoxin oxidoreductase [Bacillota bacterium]
MPVELITGNQAAALAVQRAGVELVAAYPITPQTAIVETLASLHAQGELKGEFVSVESEYAALACCSGAAAAGARVFTATSSHGLAYMHEMIHWCAGARFPIVMAGVNRALGGPWCLDPDQGDSLSQRDTGWLQLYCSSAQEVFDTIIQAYALAEKIMLPCMVIYDGFYISHTYETVDIPDREEVQRFLGPPSFAAQVQPGLPANLHGLSTGETQAKLVRERHRTMKEALAVLKEINARFAAAFNRKYEPVEAYFPGKIKNVVVAAGACADTVRWCLPRLADTGLIRLKALRPFPGEEISLLLEKQKIERIVVVDRNCSTGMGGILAQELKAALYPLNSPPAVYDLILAGGIDFTPQMLQRLLAQREPHRGFAEIWGVDLL